jgi:8-oxo-dGTP pyrophosphatase MutT (NUDIX family)
LDWSAGLRELHEETNIEYEQIMNSVSLIKKTDKVKYRKQSKYLIPYFVCLSNDDIDHLELKCNSMVDIEGREPFPEVDAFKWISFDDAFKTIHETQVKALNDFIKYGNTIHF